MPYSNVPAEDDAKMHRCVEKVMAKGHDKKSAIAICYSAIVKGEMQPLEELGFKLSDFDEVTNMAEAKLKDYPWDECIRDNTERYGDVETAKKVCGMIKAKYGHGSMKLPLEFKLDEIYPDIEKELEIEPVARALSIELSSAGLIDGREFDGMAEGEFTDMLGRGIKLAGKDFAAYAQNTQAMIESTRSETGDIIGLPIDARGHDNGDGAGWIVAVRHLVENGKNIIRMTPRWTDIGRDLIARGIRRMFSPTVDPEHKVIIGGSLTNWPATRANDGRLLLRPIELSNQPKGVLTMADETIVTTTMTPVVETPAPPAPPANLEALMADATLALQVRELIQRGVKDGVTAELEKIKRENEVAQLCAELTGGSADKPNGLPVDKGELQAFLLTLSDPQRQTLAGMFDKIRTAGLVHFEELGHASKLKHLAQLPDEMKPHLREHLAAGQSLEQFFEYNQAELGVMSDYDLAEFKPKES